MATHSRQMSEAFRTTVFLTLSGGFQDAYTYMGRGKVFANAQTGNIVLMATNFCEGDFAKALRYLLPLLAFAAGVYFAEGIRNRYHLMERFHWRQLILLIEIALLFVVGFIPNNLDWLANMLVSFVCAMQVQSFPQGARQCICQHHVHWQHAQRYAVPVHRPAHKRPRCIAPRHAVFYCDCTVCCGAAAGSLLTIHFGNRVIWFCCASLLVSLSFMFIREDIEENPELQREAAALHQDVKAMEHTIGKTLQEQQEELHPLNHK